MASSGGRVALAKVIAGDYSPHATVADTLFSRGIRVLEIKAKCVLQVRLLQEKVAGWRPDPWRKRG